VFEGARRRGQTGYFALMRSGRRRAVRGFPAPRRFPAGPATRGRGWSRSYMGHRDADL